MKKMFLLASLAFTSGSFASNIEHAAHNYVTSMNLEANQQLSDIVCDYEECTFNLFEDNKVKTNITLLSEINPVNNAELIFISSHEIQTNENSLSAVVCLSDNSCEYFDSNNLLNANYSFYNGEFAKKRQKRQALPAYIRGGSNPYMFHFFYNLFSAKKNKNKSTTTTTSSSTSR